MAEIYVPIDISDLKNVIPEGNDILYSTYAHIVEKYVYLSATKKATLKWNSHMLFTQDGFAYTEIRKKKPPNPQFYGWHMVRNIVNDKMKVMINISAQIIRHEDYETKEAFQERIKQFSPKIIPIALERLKYLRESKRDEFRKGWLKQLDRTIRKLNKELEKVNQI